MDLSLLARPMPYKWRLKMVTNKAKKPYPAGTRGQFLAYIDARDVFDRLDAVLGIANWQSHVKAVNADGSVVVGLSIRVDGEWIEREDIGYPNDPTAGVETEPLKAAVSDGVKRAAVHYGIGRFLYGLGAEWIDIDPNGNPLRALPNAAPTATAAGETVDPATGEITSAPPPARTSRSAEHLAAATAATPPARTSAAIDDESAVPDMPCAVDGCEYSCAGKFVTYSLNKYGAPFCGKHSALAKRGEMSDAAIEKARQTHQRRQSHPAAPAESSAPAASNGNAAMVDDWTAFWSWARGTGVKSMREYQEKVGESAAALGATEARRRLEALLAGSGQ